MDNTCQHCGEEIPPVPGLGEDASNRELALYLDVLGAYGEFRDSCGAERVILVLCHDCGHALMASWFPSVDVTSWHAH